MSSFTKPLTVTKISSRRWRVARSFKYYVGYEKSKEVISIPAGFETDFASVPRLFWSIIPPDGRHTQAAVLHDYLYHKHIYSRKKSDKIFLEAMKVLRVSWWRRHVMYRAVRMFGGKAWRKHG